MDIYSLSASLSLDSTELESGIGRAQAAFGSLGTTASSVCGEVQSAFAALAHSMQNVGQMIWEGLRAGLAGSVAGVRSWAQSLVDEVKDVMDIHSPSRVFMEIGRNMADGLTAGWGEPFSDIYSSVSREAGRIGQIDFASSAMGKSSSAAIGSYLAAAEQRSGDGLTVHVELDGRVLASLLLDPLNNTAKQKGVTFGA